MSAAKYRRGSWWIADVEEAISRTALAVRLSRPGDPASPEAGLSESGYRAISSAIDGELVRAANIVAEYDLKPWYARLGRAAATYERALSAVRQAAQDALLIADEAEVLARVIELRSAVKTALSPVDPRTDSFLRLCDRLLSEQERREQEGYR
jgi:hypothetical protein